MGVLQHCRVSEILDWHSSCGLGAEGQMIAARLRLLSWYADPGMARQAQHAAGVSTRMHGDVGARQGRSGCKPGLSIHASITALPICPQTMQSGVLNAMVGQLPTFAVDVLRVENAVHSLDHQDASHQPRAEH